MFYSVRKSFRRTALKRIALGIGMGAAGLLGANVLAQDNNQSYQNPPASTQGTLQEEQTSPRSNQSSQGRQYQEQPSAAQGSQAGSQSRSQSQMKGESSRETASASQSSESAKGQQSQGTIRSVDTSSKTLSLKGARMHRDIAWSDQTQVLRNGKEVSPEDLKKGERVSVTFRKEGDQLIAQQIVIRERQQARATRHHHRGY